MRKARIPGKTTNTDLALVVQEILELPLNKNTKYPTEGAKIVKAIAEVLTKALRRGESIHIRGFGKFTIRKGRKQYIKKPIAYNTSGQYSPNGTIYSDTPQEYPGKLYIHFQPSIQLTAMLNINNPNVHERDRAIAKW